MDPTWMDPIWIQTKINLAKCVQKNYIFKTVLYVSLNPYKGRSNVKYFSFSVFRTNFGLSGSGFPTRICWPNWNQIRNSIVLFRSQSWRRKHRNGSRRELTRLRKLWRRISWQVWVTDDCVLDTSCHNHRGQRWIFKYLKTSSAAATKWQ
jgi:hypothetical protein